jgi:hypothetical protein
MLYLETPALGRKVILLDYNNEEAASSLLGSSSRVLQDYSYLFMPV